MIIVTFLVAAAVTFSLRSCVTVIGRPVPAWLDRISGLVTPAILASMVAAGVLVAGAERRVELPSPAVVAALACMFVVTRRRNNVVTGLAVALPVFWLLSNL